MFSEFIYTFIYSILHTFSASISIQDIARFFEIAFEAIRTWWWFPLPFLLWEPATFHWLWWRNEVFESTWKWILLEVKIPEESLKPIRAMEAVLSGMWQMVYAPPNWYEKWWKGEYLMKFCLELVAIDGTPHFFIRIPERGRNIAESHIYSQYPEAEISVVEDYTQNVPQDIPNKDWEMWGADYKLFNKDPYPIKTYTEFETERELEEEKRVDPLASLLEGMAKLKPGEQLWVQIVVTPVSDEDTPFQAWHKEGETIRNKLARRKSPSPLPSIFKEIVDLLASGKVPGEAPEDKEAFAPELKLTPGERDVVAAIEKKLSKIGFLTHIRYIYLGRKDVYFGGNLRIAMSYFPNFSTDNCNKLVPSGATLTKVKQSWYNWFWFVKRRLYLKKRKKFRNCVWRVNHYFPDSGGTFILNAEELASIFHFPSRAVAPAPTVLRVEAKKGEAPPGLPTE